VGLTPNEALLDFDKAFDRAAGEQIILAAEAQGISIEQPETKPKKKKNSNEMD